MMFTFTVLVVGATAFGEQPEEELEDLFSTAKVSHAWTKKPGHYCNGKTVYPGHSTLEQCKAGCSADVTCKCFTWRTDKKPNPTCSFETERSCTAYNGYTSYVKERALAHSAR